MKRLNRLIILSFLFALCFGYNSVYGKNETSVRTNEEFTGNIHFDTKIITPGTGVLNHQLQGVCSGGKCIGNYKVNIITLSESSIGVQNAKAYCVFPELDAERDNEVTCGEVSPNNFPRTYYLVYTYWDQIKDNPTLANFTMRMAGILDKDAKLAKDRWEYCQGKAWREYPECEEPSEGYTRYCDRPEHSNEDRCRRWAWTGVTTLQTHLESAFVASWQSQVDTYTLTNGYKPYIFRGTVADEAYTLLKDVNAHVSEVENYWEVVTTDSESGYDKNENVIEGDLVKATKIEEEIPQPRKALYEISSKDGSNIGEITITALDGSSFVWVSAWDGSKGIIQVTANAKCKAKIRVVAGHKKTNRENCESNGGTWKYTWNPTGCTEKIPETCRPVEYTYTACDCDVKGNCSGCHEATGTRQQCDTRPVGCNVGRCDMSTAARTTSTVMEKDVEINNGGYAIETADLELDSKPAYMENSNDTIQNTFNPKEIRSDITIYYCHIDGELDQSYIVVDDGTKGNELSLPVDCDNCYVGDCTPAPKYSEFAQKDIHNCCDESVSVIRQYALDELFCTDIRTGIGTIDHYKEKCNVKNTDYEYWKDETGNPYCVMYCSNTVTYRIPGPTHAKSDMYFLFTRMKKNGSDEYLEFNGPQYDHYRRCRTIIRYDEWNGQYSSTADELIKDYNNYQYEEAAHQMWIDIEANPKWEYINGVNGETVTCTRTVTYDSTCEDNYIVDYDCISRNGSRRSHAQSCNSNETPIENWHYGTKPCSENASFSSESTLGAHKIDVYNESYYSKDYYVYTLGTYQNTYYYPVNRTRKTRTGSQVFYSRSMYDTYTEDRASLASTLTTSVNSQFGTWRQANSGKNITADTTNCGQPVSYNNLINVSDKVAEKAAIAENAKRKYNADVAALSKLEKQLNQCSGTYNANGAYDAQSIKDRVQFTKEDEPELEFSYVQGFFSDKGEYVDQEIEVPFVKVDANGNKQEDCVKETLSSIVDSIPSDWNDLWGSIGWQDDHYFSRDGNLHILPVGNYQTGIHFETSNTGFTGISNNNYYASRKYTTDAVGHMTCRWKDDSDNVTYNLVPNGLVVTVDYKSQGNIADLNLKNYSRRSGAYYVAKTTARGKYEVYYTLKNIGGRSKKSGNEGLFDDIVHKEGETCSGFASTNFKGTDVNLSCYIEVQSTILSMYDCSERKDTICDKGDTNCPSGCKEKKEIALDYKEVDPADPFPNYDNYKNNGNKGYAFNWKNEKDENAKEVLKHITETAQKDKTYSKEELTYSFTFTPKELKLIRAYNKSRIKYGGYNDFEMRCDNVGYTSVGTDTSNPVTRCRSKFLEAISGAKDNGIKELDFNAANVPLEEARKKTNFYKK